MKKLHSFFFYALTTPVITLGAGSLLAQQSTEQELDRAQQNSQRSQDSTRSAPLVTEGEQSTQRAAQSASQPAVYRGASGDQSQNRSGYLSSAPANGIHADDLIGAEVTTTGEEDVGPVEDLIINQDGQIVAIVVGVGGFLGLGEKQVAIGWDDVTMVAGSDLIGSNEIELQISATREALSSAPEFESQD